MKLANLREMIQKNLEEVPNGDRPVEIDSAILSSISGGLADGNSAGNFAKVTWSKAF